MIPFQVYNVFLIIYILLKTFFLPHFLDCWRVFFIFILPLFIQMILEGICKLSSYPLQNLSKWVTPSKSLSSPTNFSKYIQANHKAPQWFLIKKWGVSLAGAFEIGPKSAKAKSWTTQISSEMHSFEEKQYCKVLPTRESPEVTWNLELGTWK